MPRTAADRCRPLPRTAAAIGVIGLIALGAAPASADGPQPVLALAPVSPVLGVKPGSSFEVPVAFANKGTTTLEKVYITYVASYGLAHRELPSNCTRSDLPEDDDMPAYSSAVCEFDQTLKPGAVYAPEKVLSLNVLDHALYDSVWVSVATGPGEEDPDRPEHPVPGTGPVVKLIELPSTTPVGDSDPEHPDRDGAKVSVTAANTADLKVTGARSAGRVGDTVTVQAKITNTGPAWLAPSDHLPQTLITMPSGTTVTEAPDYCYKTATGSYNCYTSMDWFDVGDGQPFTFTLRIDRAVPGAKGSVTFDAKQAPYDKNRKNDTAAILLDIDGADGGSTSGGGSVGGNGSTGGSGSTSTAGGSGSGSPGGSGSTGGSTGGSGSAGGSASAGSPGSSTTGGDLASTGSGSALSLAGLATAALAVGAGTVLLVRRRAARR
ncbi:hypothetical protein ACF07B_05825 [Streptomyces sp. NPDC015532]|uniref:hypothetical protein n=1 Tax=Streptomyces sp. NPDC015532 TaxID=3364960 RepID=UPI0036F7077F